MQPRLAVRAIRYYVPSVKQTQVEGFLQVPYAMTEPAGNRIAWETTVAITDAAGNRLGSQSWWSGRPASAREPEAVGMESLRFPPMMAGKYLIRVSVKDSVSGKVSTTETALDAFGASPGVSDLLLANAMRRAAPGDTLLAPGEFSHGNYRFMTSPELQLDPINPVLSYLLEAYSDVETESSAIIEVLDAGGKSIYKLPPSRQKIPAGGGVIGGQLPLEGLAEGNYKFVISVTVANNTVERSGEFSVGGLEAALARNMAAQSAAKGIDEVYFGTMTEEKLDEAAEALQLLVTPKQLAVYKKSGPDRLSLTAKRAFLVNFWASRDQDKTTPENEYRMHFYEAVAYANAAFPETGRGARPGWKTDRGRVWARNGAPDDNFKQAQQGRAPAYQIWRYTRGKLRYYLFADRTGIGNYALMTSNDLKELSTPGWIEIMTPEAVRDIGQYLGLNLFEISPGSTTMSPPALEQNKK
jgi:GWxTD domain-containing protein